MVQVWGHDGVVTVDASPIHHLLPESVPSFLGSVGLPKHVPEIFRLLDPARWRTVTAGGTNREAGLGDLWVMSQNYSVATVLDLDSRSIWQVDLRGMDPPTFVNSSLPQFVEFLVAVEERRLSLGGEEVAFNENDQRVVDQLTVIDPPAFSRDDATWAVFFEELEYGIGG